MGMPSSADRMCHHEATRKGRKVGEPGGKTESRHRERIEPRNQSRVGCSENLADTRKSKLIEKLVNRDQPDMTQRSFGAKENGGDTPPVTVGRGKRGVTR